jgi:hypothetical protein
MDGQQVSAVIFQVSLAPIQIVIVSSMVSISELWGAVGYLEYTLHTILQDFKPHKLNQSLVPYLLGQPEFYMK